MLILCIFGGIVQKIIGVTVVYTENICSKHFLIKIGWHILCMKSYGIRDSELTHYRTPEFSKTLFPASTNKFRNQTGFLGYPPR